ncbi:uncharacterized protein KY384_006584 [Bacidia gigantensis]|uniref:uncharacterized protein n=1 Tax=Bacidia gigantensis TaxID=2732470 RepID=UPI001D037F00|nr:uncharacterized protein KY384_006584 [Bacidia gigantensis]KAG8528895.1 hypothetical protein KY384_006584 [Bacidia gigantensis]
MASRTTIIPASFSESDEADEQHWLVGNNEQAPATNALDNPALKYRRRKPLDLPNRQWPSKSIDKPPRWLATDLRDGNQSLADPMDSNQKYHYFQMLVKLGYKEIEVSFPSASDTDYDFTRRLLETTGTVPEDVWLQVLSPCREELIQRTVESLRGSKKAILHLYLATSPCFQRIVFGFTQQQGLDLAVRCTKLARKLTKDDPSQAGTEWAYEFSPETFSDTDPDYAIRVCEAVKAAWGPSESNPIIFNLPATVEVSTPNVYADQIEYFCRNMTERPKFCVSLHPHNDRGCAVAAAELAQMAGADRVEGVLFGNGERTGNVDLFTLAMNLYTQGIHPKIDYSDINPVIDLVEQSNKIPVHQRHPYAGELVHTAFSGSHQDAINKGFKDRKERRLGNNDEWDMPYLPLDPQDIGRTYEAIIRVNSQSGKGGVAWIIQRSLELELPRGLQVAFSKIVQKRADTIGQELRANEIQQLFEEVYYLKDYYPRFTLIDYNIATDRAESPAPPEKGRTLNTAKLKRHFEGTIADSLAHKGEEYRVKGSGNGPISALAHSLQSIGIDLDVVDYKEHSIGGGSDTKAATYIECLATETGERIWGIGINTDTVQASLMAFLAVASTYFQERPVNKTPSPKTKFSSLHNLAIDARLNGSIDGQRGRKMNGVVNGATNDA